MARGGYRWDGNSNWNSGKTSTIRVPLALQKQILELANALDKGYEVTINELPIIDAIHIKEVTTKANELIELHQTARALAEALIEHKAKQSTSPRSDKLNKLYRSLDSVPMIDDWLKQFGEPLPVPEIK